MTKLIKEEDEEGLTNQTNTINTSIAEQMQLKFNVMVTKMKTEMVEKNDQSELKF